MRSPRRRWGVCLFTGLRAGGGIGDILTVPINIVNGTSMDTWQYLGLRAIFDLLFFIMIRSAIRARLQCKSANGALTRA